MRRVIPATLYRGTVSEAGSLAFTSGVDHLVAFFPVQEKTQAGATGEVIAWQAEAFFGATADVRARDHVVVHGRRFEVLRLVSGYDLDGTVHHVGAQLREADAG